ncbi:MAG: tetratricopeptide repeat protein, partial [Bacteroidota bacterium]
GDGFYVTSDYDRALDYYDQAIALEQRSQADYVRYQKAIALGLNQRVTDKIAQLEELARDYSHSRLMDAVEYELGRSYANTGRTEEAIRQFRKVIDKYDANENRYVHQSLASLGRTYYNENRSQDARETYDKMLELYSSYDKTKEAWAGLKQIYIDQNNVQEWIVRAKASGYYNISVAAEDSAYYIVAENAYFAEDYALAQKSFDYYLEEYDQPLFALNAHFYRADCNFRNLKYAEALEDYAYVAEQPHNRFSERSLFRAGAIHYRNENWAKADEYYGQLAQVAESQEYLTEALVGRMRTTHRLKRPNEALKLADKVLNEVELEEAMFIEAHFVKGRAAFDLDDLDLAYQELKITADTTNNVQGAEAKYHMALIRFRQDDYPVAEQEVFEFVRDKKANGFWTAKSLILLADVYTAIGDLFQARA